ncbi:Oxysterol-binding protein- protein 1 [Dermatophagoides pteronyssinus]|uniref:Oxysterol-binding protein n=1 Tax=Dermatophagoides pteronyssinus TaxID=6956 RepID=A0ABQ8IZQ9_DERPT|nr:Oxysterol-binding protein- protein 1 [Dermatophagoides pteronyssinus]
MEKSSLILHTLNNNTKNTSEMDVNNVEPIDSTLFSMYNNDNNYHHDDDNLVKFTANSKHRDRLPAPMVPRDEVGLWSILKHCIGKELSKITFPVIFNEPLSFLQRMTELFHYTHYLNIADQCDDIVERMENICAYIVSAYSSNWLRLNKPFNPLLGETFEYEIESSQTKIVCEQVSHHPPISAWHAESPHFILRGTSAPKLRFWGKSIEVKPEGTATLELKSRGEIYTWKSVNCCVHNIIVGKIWFEQYGTVEVTNHMNRFKLFINFKPAGWFGYDLNRLDGYIHDSEKEKLRFVYGKWNDYLKSASIEDYEEYLKANNNKFRAPDKPTDIGDKGGEHLNNHHSSNRSKMLSKLNSFTKQLTGSLDLGAGGNNDNQQQINDSSDLPPEPIESDIPKSDSSHSLDINNSRILWKAEPRPEHSSQYYNFNWFTFGLNELPEDDNERQELLKRLPPTDSRLRPDIRKLEEGDLDVAAAEKNRLEEKQREARRLRKKGKIKEFQPLWFRPELNQYTGQEDWMFTNEYWTKRDWSRCPDIF